MEIKLNGRRSKDGADRRRWRRFRPEIGYRLAGAARVTVGH